MKLRLSFSRVALFAAVLAATGVAVLEFRTRQIDQRSLEDYRAEDLQWTVSQLQMETIRYAEALSRFRAEQTDAAAANAVERFDILWSRASLFTAGRTAQRLAALDREGVVGATLGFLARHEAAGADPAAARSAELALMLAQLQALERALQRFSAMVLDHEERRLADVVIAITDSNTIGSLRAAAALAAAMLVAAAAWAQGRADRRELATQRALREAAEEASDTRRRFLTMMSHELRTPMNGVLGLLSLAESAAEDGPQRLRLRAARRCATEMVFLIEDILELSDIETGALDREPVATTPASLAAAVLDALAQRRLGEGWALCVDPSAEPTAPLRIDADSYVKAVTHAASFFLDRLGVVRLTLALAVRDGALVATLGSVDPASARWDPQAFVGALEAAEGATGDAIRTEAIGPAIARGLIRKLGGRGFVHRRPDGGAVITISAPLAPSAAAPAARAEVADPLPVAQAAVARRAS